MTLPNGIVATYTYDAASQLTGIGYAKPDATLIGDLSYSYNAVGQRIGVTGSLARTSLSGAIGSASYDSANRLTNWNGAAIAYDANGNMLSDGVRSYTWDARDRLTAISGGANASFQYDAFGRRLSKTVGGVTTGYVYDGANPVQELTGAVPSANILTGLGIDELYRRTDAAGSRDVMTDALGSVIALADSLAQVKTEYTYGPYGATTVSGEANGNPFQYTGRENDGTGLYYYRARYYNPEMSRFVQSDPIGLAGGINTYTYVDGNPVSLIDPLGLAATPPAGTPYPTNIPGGPWTWSPNPQNPRGGQFIGPKQPSGPRPTCTYAPPKPDFNPDPYWKVTDPNGNTQRYNTSGNPITPDEAHPGPDNPQIPSWLLRYGPIGAFVGGMIYSSPVH